MNGRLSIHDLPKRYQEQVSQQIHQPVLGHAAVHPVVPTPKKRLRQKAAGMNKTEQSFHDYLKSLNIYSWIYPQSVTLLLANGVRYTPDFVCAKPGRFSAFAKLVADDSGPLGDEPRFKFVAYETKGFMRDDAGVKIKCAATMFPWIEFNLVTRAKKEWQIQRILPGPVTP